jgi:hypothetical protein
MPYDAAAAGRVIRLIWCTLGCLLLAVIVGFGWDRAWHATHPFEDFWSPPHLFIYSTLALTAGILARLAGDADLRAHVGAPTMAIPLLGRISPPLFMAVAGLAMVFLAGALDSIWHTLFGLDETGWSLPHAMLGWGLLVTLFGLVSSRFALDERRHPGWFSRAVLALLLVASVTGVLLGPLGSNNSPSVVRAIASLPVLAAEPEAQHTFRIYLDWNITRTGLLFVPLAALASGAALKLGRALIPGALALLAVIVVASLFSLSSELRTARYLGVEDDPQNWLPLPILPALIVFLVSSALRLPERVSWLLGGLSFGVIAASWWGQPGAVALVAAPAMVAGALLGTQLEKAIFSPQPGSAAIVALGAGLAVPGLLGALDLYLRTATA